LDAFSAAVELLPRIAMLSMDVLSRQRVLTFNTNGVVCQAIRSGQHVKAIELLEAGRGVFWSQALQLRTPMTNLRDVAPKLEQKLRRISSALEQGSFLDARHCSDTLQTVSTDEAHRLNNEWLSTLEEVRRLDGFQDFLLPSRLSTLQGAAANGPVVILNTSRSGSDALIMTSSYVQHIPLLGLDFIAIRSLAKLIQNATATNHTLLPGADQAQTEGLFLRMPELSDRLRHLRQMIEDRHIGRASDAQMLPEDTFRMVLAMLWVWVVHPVIRSLNLEVNSLFICITNSFASRAH
jgi:hypothetical protein